MSAILCTKRGPGGCVLGPNHGSDCLPVADVVPLLLRPRQPRARR